MFCEKKFMTIVFLNKGEMHEITLKNSCLRSPATVYYVCRNSKANCYCEAVTFNNWIMTKKKERHSRAWAAFSFSGCWERCCVAFQWDQSRTSVFQNKMYLRQDSPKVLRWFKCKKAASNCFSFFVWKITKLLLPPPWFFFLFLYCFLFSFCLFVTFLSDFLCARCFAA